MLDGHHLLSIGYMCLMLAYDGCMLGAENIDVGGNAQDEKARLNKTMREAVFEEQTRVFRNNTENVGYVGKG